MIMLVAYVFAHLFSGDTQKIINKVDTSRYCMKYFGDDKITYISVGEGLITAQYASVYSEFDNSKPGYVECCKRYYNPQHKLDEVCMVIKYEPD